MKQKRFFPVILCCIAAMSFFSCLNDDNDSNLLTEKEIAQCLSAVKGNYSGDLIFYSLNATNPDDLTDTLAVTWTISNDSTMTIADFPARLLAEKVTDTDLKDALAAAPNQDITCRIGFTKTSPVQFLINPITPTYTLNYGGNVHKVQIAFYVNSYYSIGIYDSSSKKLQMRIIEGAVYVDDKLTTYLSTEVPFIFSSTNKE